MSWKVIRICDRCCDAKMTDYEAIDVKKYSVNGKDYVLCDRCIDELRELNKRLDNYVNCSRVEFFKRGVNA